MNSKLGFGPMSFEIVDALCQYSQNNKTPLMIIASRNQVDDDSGYVMSTSELGKAIAPWDKEFILLCRDHCGPYFLDSEKHLSERDAVLATKKTIEKDIECGFDLIHIDTSRCKEGYKVAESLIKFCLDLNPNIMFEFGTEENIGVVAGIERYKSDVNFAKQFPNMQFVVAQTGSLTKEDKQCGTFNSEIVQTLVNYANSAGVKLKEHNADYLTANEIQLRKNVGVHALNIAPQLGVLQTRCVKELCSAHGLNNEWNEFAQLVLESKKWQKWMISNDNNLKVDVASHYLFQSDKFKIITQKLSQVVDWQSQLNIQLEQVFDLYDKNL